MVSAALNVPGIRLGVAELLALRDTAPRRERYRPTSRRPGMLASAQIGAGMDLREIRAFAEGDDARRIDPAATARTGVPHIRSFHADRDDTLLLIADFRPCMLWGTGTTLRSVRGARELVRRGWQAIARGGALAALSVTGSGVAALRAGGGASHMNRLVHMLADTHDQALEGEGGEGALSETLIRAARLAPPGGEVLLATGADGISPADEPALVRLARRRRVRLLLPLDPLESAPPSPVLPIHCGTLTRYARLAPFDGAELTRRMRGLNVTVEALADDAG